MFQVPQIVPFLVKKYELSQAVSKQISSVTSHQTYYFPTSYNEKQQEDSHWYKSKLVQLDFCEKCYLSFCQNKQIKESIFQILKVKQRTLPSTRVLMPKNRKFCCHSDLEKTLLENREKVGLFYVQLLKDYGIFTANIQNINKDRSATVFYLEMVAFCNELSPHIQKNFILVNTQQNAPILSLNNFIQLSRCNKNLRNKSVVFFFSDIRSQS